MKHELKATFSFWAGHKDKRSIPLVVLNTDAPEHRLIREAKNIVREQHPEIKKFARCKLEYAHNG